MQSQTQKLYTDIHSTKLNVPKWPNRCTETDQ